MPSQAEANLQALLESTDDLIWSVDLEGRLCAFNQAIRNHIYLYFHTELALGMRFHELFPPALTACWDSFYAQAQKEGPFQTEYTQLSGSTLELSFNPIQVDGTPSGISVFARDITARKLNEEQLRHLAAAVECSQDAIITHAPDGRIQTWNRAAEKLYGYRAEEAIGQPLALLVPSGRSAAVQQHYDDVLAGKSHSNTPGVALHRSGRPIQVSVSSWPIRNASGEITSISDVIRDVTGREEAERAKAFLAALVESSGDAIHGVSIDGAILSWNPGAERLTGFTREEIVGKHISYVAHDTPEQVRNILAHISKGQPVPLFETLFRHKSGRWIDVSVSVSPVRDSGGRIVGTAAIARDIGQRAKLRQELSAAEKKYRTIFDGALEGMYQATLTGQVLTANAAAARMLGYDSAEDLIASVEDVGVGIWVSTDARAQYNQAISNPMGKAVLGFECQFRRKDGSIIWVSLNGRMVLDEHAQPLYHEGFIEDITERKLATEAMAESESRFRSLFEDSKAVLLLVEPVSGEITDANRAAAAYYGYPREQLVGANVTLINTLPADNIREERERAVREERKYFSFHHRLASGEIREVQVYSSPVRVSGRMLLYSNVFDVTEQCRAEQKLRENAEILDEAQKIGGLGSYSLDFATGQWSSSERMDELFGIGPEYVHDVNGWLKLVHPEDFLMMEEYIFQEVIAERHPFDKEYRIVRQLDHAERWVHGLGKLDFDAEGKPQRLRGVIKDITEHKNAEIALRASEQRYRSAFQMSIDTVLLTRVSDGIIIDANNAFCKIMGYSREEVIGKTSDELGFWNDPADHLALRQALFAEGVCRNHQCQFRRKDGELLWGMMSVTIVELDGVACALSVTRDITQAKAAEEKLLEAQRALQSSEERYRTVFRASLDCISISRVSDGAIIDVNQSFLELLGFDLAEVLGRTCAELNLWAEPGARERMAEVLLQDGSFRDARTRYRKKNGDLLWVLISSSLIEIEGESCTLSMIRDVSDAKAAEDKIWNLAFYDPLTRLPNRRLLMDRLRQTLSAGGRSPRMRALLFIDLDNFKTLNDTLGHQNGDQLLREVARRLMGCVRESDTVARLGGDEFVVLLDGLDYHPENAAAQAESIGKKILSVIEMPFWLDDREHFSTSSLGITVFGGNHGGANELLQQADIAMYQAKSAGRNTMRFFEPALQTAVQERAELGDEMRVGIRNGQFLLHLQPQMASSGMVGAEALVRWRHPRRGLLLPGEFIALAEETGMILPLGDWVLEAACVLVAEWQRRKPAQPMSISVNISARQFHQSTFVSQVLATLDKTGADPVLLNLEITESILLDNIEEAIVKMQHLKDHGVKFSLDDFGTGYSSLSYLKRLPFDQLKIDRSFVRDLLEDVGSRAIAQTVISLGHALGLDVLAEGVETQEQLDLLESLSCHSFQGFLFSQPLPIDEFEKNWLLNPTRSGASAH